MSDALAEIKKLYFSTSKKTILRDFDRAIDLLKSMPSEEERDRAAVFMDGLAQMRAQWAGAATAGRPLKPRRPKPAKKLL